MNRPFGAVDVAANLKGAVPKTATQKILVALAEKGELVQKTYGMCLFSFALMTLVGYMLYACDCMLGKTTFFVANQANLDAMPAEKLKALEDEHKAIEEANKALAAEVKAANAGEAPTGRCSRRIPAVANGAYMCTYRARKAQGHTH